MCTMSPRQQYRWCSENALGTWCARYVCNALPAKTAERVIEDYDWNNELVCDVCALLHRSSIVIGMM